VCFFVFSKIKTLTVTLTSATVQYMVNKNPRISKPSYQVFFLKLNRHQKVKVSDVTEKVMTPCVSINKSQRQRTLNKGQL